MDVGLGLGYNPDNDKVMWIVLILVLVDVGLGPTLKAEKDETQRRVLILVLVDVGLGQAEGGCLQGRT